MNLINHAIKKSLSQKIKEKAQNARERLNSLFRKKSSLEERQKINFVKSRLNQKKTVKNIPRPKERIQKKVSSKDIMQKNIFQKNVLQQKRVQKRVVKQKKIKGKVLQQKPIKKKGIRKKTVKKKVLKQKAIQNKIVLKKHIHKNIIPIVPRSSRTRLKDMASGQVIVKSVPKKSKPDRSLVVAISGTPGTGKTTIARRIEKEFGILHLDVNSIIKEYSLSEGYDPVKRCEIIDTNKLKKALIMLILKAKRPIIIDSHLSHFLPKEYIDLCIITKCSPKTLNKRLLKRGYHDAKIRENLDSEIFEVCMNEAIETGHNIYIIETEQTVDLSGLKERLKIFKHS
jgi:adenylate kinase